MADATSEPVTKPRASDWYRDRLTSRSTDAVGRDDGDAGAPVGPMSAPPAETVQAHGQMNPLAWDNLPTTLRDTMDTIQSLAVDVTNISVSGETSPKQPQPIAIPQSAAPPPDRQRHDSAKRRSRHIVQPKGTVEYTVSGRDTLASIAAQFETTTSELKKLNKLMGTDFVFPGQVLYVPDKDYESSSSASPMNSPVDSAANKPFPPLSPTQQLVESQLKQQKSFEVPMVRQTERSRGPGHAQRQTTPDPPKARAPDPPRPLSEDEVKRLDEECFERFIKVNVKHITDGQGVVSGVLLVTPNAIMFDPNVSDPLVMDRGTEAYGMIAPMETIISAAMYHDIAAMKLQNQEKNADNHEKHEVYHGKSCPLYKKEQAGNAEKSDEVDSRAETAAELADTTGGDSPEKTEEPEHRMHGRTESVCSCGGDVNANVAQGAGAQLAK